VKILLLSNLYPPDAMGGYERGARQVADALRARGHEVRVLTSIPRAPVPPQPHVRRTLRLVDVWSDYLFAHNAPVTNHLAQAESHRVSAANVHALLAELDDFRPDVVYAWMLTGLGGLGLMGALARRGVPWAWHLMDDVPLQLCTAAGRVVPAFAEGFARHLRGNFLACSRQLVDEIERGGVAIGDDVEVLPNWIAGPLGPPREAYLRDGRLAVASAAGLIDRRGDKGFDLLVEAAALLRERRIDNVSIDLYGEVADGSIPDLIRARELDGFVHLRGPLPQSELISRLADYDLFAFPTREREPFGFVALEAAAMGCVPVVSRRCGIAEWLVHGVHCLKTARTPEALARSLRAAAAGQVDLAGIGRRAASVARRDFRLDAILPRIESALARAAARPAAGPALPADEVYRLALLAERVSRVIIQESLPA
jgi:glycosyltransferase involved in cell wall biosynthesis